MGAWIETDTTTSGMTAIIRSHPTWVRGLKRKVVGICIAEGVIAPYVGAWIETQIPKNVFSMAQIAPYVGAWIETGCLPSGCANSRVAHYVGAWIET